MICQMLEAINLGCVRGERRLFSNLNFTLPAGTLLQVQGPNGSGKTSLLRMICGLLTPAEGEICWKGSDIHSLREEYSRTITYVGHRNGVKEELSSVDNLRINTGLAGVEITPNECQATLGRVGLAGREHLPARLLSEGQRRRLALARLLSIPTMLWILDEVLASLDNAAVEFVRSLLAEHLSNGGIAIIATHQELDLAAAGSFQCLQLPSGVPSDAASLGWSS